MANQQNERTIAALEKMMQEMQHLVDHPRMQQRNWVAKGRVWLPILQHAQEDLQREVAQQDFITESYQSLLLVLEHVGLKVEKRDETSWGYCWHDDSLMGAYPTRAAAIEAGLRERLK